MVVLHRAFTSVLMVLGGTLLTEAFLPPPPSFGRASRVMIFTSPTSATTTDPATTEKQVRLEDANVPESHKGLHEFLYGDDETHGASDDEEGDDDEAPIFTKDKVFEVSNWLSSNGRHKIAGVYSVEDRQGRVRYIGLSRDVVVSLKSHVGEHGDEACHRLRIQSFSYPRRDQMEALQSKWIEELGYTPEGNEKGGWASSIREAGQSGMTLEQKMHQEELKIKLRTAMADMTLVDEMEKMDTDEAERRARLLQAVEGDNWTAEIEAQTKATIDQLRERAAAAAARASPEPASANAGSGAIESPFAGDAAGARKGVAEDEKLELNAQNVDKVLDEVRPYLISDGGNIEVVSVDPDKQEVYLRLQGACGSCPSSTTTMKMGVERVLKEKFPNLTKVEAVSPVSVEGGDSGEPQEVLRQLVETKLSEILPAIRGLGAMAAVEEVTGVGDVTIAFRGPEKVKLGVIYALKSLQGVQEVRAVVPK